MPSPIHLLYSYTLSHEDPDFIHQHVVDAYGAQLADESCKEITTVFCLVGLCLYVEQDFTGRQVQDFHQRMSEHKIEWPKIELPEFRGAIEVKDVLAAAPGPERDAMIQGWSVSVWDAYEANWDVLRDLVERYEDE